MITEHPQGEYNGTFFVDHILTVMNKNNSVTT
jgi:hypothetical protein